MGFVTPFGLLKHGLGECLETRVGDQPYGGVADSLALAILVQSRHREARVRSYLSYLSYLYLDRWPLLPQTGDDPLQDRHRPAAGVGVAGAQERGDEVAGVAIEDQERMGYICCSL